MNEVEEIKSRLDIAEVIGGYVQLKQAGRNFKGLSPFKTEKTPSFMVSPEKGIWHDFSSGEGGDVISFVMKMEGVPFPEALEMLARRAGVELQRRGRGGPDSQTRQRLYDAVDAAVKYYHLTLSKNKTALDYLKTTRGLSIDTIKTFRLGYAPDRWDSLTKYLAGRGFKPDQLKAAGLGGQGQHGGFDIFRGRIMFPIYDVQGRPVGFSGRILVDDGEAAKYINTPETAIYHKSMAIYGLLQAKAAIRQAGEVILVEGNIDVLSLHQAGIQNVVAVSGTALTTQQLKSLSYLADTMYVCFDGDRAGQAAAKRAVELAAEAGVTLRIITLPTGQDPDSLVRGDAKAFDRLKQAAPVGLDYLFDQATSQFSVDSASGKKQISDFVAIAIVNLTDSIEQDHYVKRLAQSLNVSEEATKNKLFRRKADVRESVKIGEKVSVEIEPPSKNITLENNLLELTLAYADTREALAHLESADISPANLPLFAAMTRDFKITLQQLSEALPQLANHAKILALRGEEAYADLSAHDRQLEAFTQVHQLQELHIKQARQQLSRELAEAERSGDTKSRDNILKRIQATLNEE